MRATSLAFMALPVALLTACSSSADSDASHMQHGTDVPRVSRSNGSEAANAADVMFVQMMIPHHEQAVAMANLAAANTTNAKVLNLAAVIKAAQQPEIDKMNSWLDEWGVTPMHHSMGDDGMLTQDQMNELADARADAFDQLFLKGMIAHHKGAISMAQVAVASGKSTAVRELAQHIITSQAAEVATMNALLGN